jgi:hypothetical protein
MSTTEKLDTHRKALSLNLDRLIFGSFAEIGAGQEVARWFLVVGAASGTVAKTISAYDKEVSDDLYGSGSRYVSKQRLNAMLDREWAQLLSQLDKTRGSGTRFFCFVDTISARNYAGSNEAHGWMGLRFQQQPGGEPNEVVLHINLRDRTNILQQEAIGMMGVNLIYAAFHQSETKEDLLKGIAQDVEKRIEIDFVELSGDAFQTWDQRELVVHLVRNGLAEAVCFPSSDPPLPPTEVLYKKPVVLAPGYFVHADRVQGEIHARMLASAIRQLQRESAASQAPKGFFCVTSAPPNPNEPPPQASELLYRIDALRSRGGDVLLFREQELYTQADFINRYTKEAVRFVVGLSVIIRTFEDRYSKLDGNLLRALAHLFAQNVRIYAYPMMASDLHKMIENISANGWEWSQTNGLVSARQLHPASAVGHLYEYLLASQFLIPIE